MKIPALLLLAALPLPAAPPPVPDACERLRTARILLPLAEEEEAARGLVVRLVADSLHEARGPLPDGTYRWARLSEKAAIPVSRGVEVDRSQLEWKMEGEHWFAIRIQCPKKKNLFWGNAPVMLRSVTLDDGRGPRVLAQDRHLARGEELQLPFGAIVPHAAVTVVFERYPDSERDPTIAVEALQAGLWDDPANPQWELAKLLRELSGERPAGELYAARLDQALEGCAPPAKRELEYILYLLKGAPREQEEGRRRLEALLERM